MKLPEPRFVVRSVTDCAIRADAIGSVAAFDAPERGGYPAGGEERRRQADARAAELNAGAL